MEEKLNLIQSIGGALILLAVIMLQTGSSKSEDISPTTEAAL